ncbi:MAG: DUF5125 domain-containing protein [Dysgonomonas sp.]|jgi:hypothetical protein|uniref:DUF5125 domain-containing protein n=1 Tax=unclassified Dysgonomonas TaxID=2630389 RepID=UPI0025C5AD1F|nr:MULTISPECIES: DUF5125 domain-containing protein [unclassified Dysgonomonas]MDR1718352.1 DUF5125 domain-containing protein [Prevotella sp.]MDR2003391.1 DUF5125 domain-containing protein [Prevotella sp.]HMM04844.1 DUF5125 domain-containing protein [Dysgonomonas sp.]
MKKYIYLLIILSGFVFLNSCSDDDEQGPGNPVIEPKTEFGSAMFGDSLPFSMAVSDDVPLSTLKVRLYFSDELVSEEVIRTKTNGEYSGKIYIPYYANIPDGTAILKFVLQNTSLTISEKSYELSLTRPDFPYLTLVSGETEYRMERTGLYQYEAKETFPMKVPGYIKAPAVGNYGNEISFGWEDNAITQGSVSTIPFSNFPGEYAIEFNTYNYEASPFIVAYTVNGTVMERIDDSNYKVEMNLTKGQEITVDGIDNFSDWWIDQDFFTKDADGNLTFAPIDGKYRITANFDLQYLRVEAMIGSSLATLQSDGTGAIWIIGDNIGKPSVATNLVGWNTASGLCLAPVGGKKYQITVVAGKSITAESINFKFFHQRDWGGEFGGDDITTTSDIVFIGNGTNGRDSGNLGIVEGKSLEKDATYVFTVDLSAGNDNAVLTVVKK